MNVNFSIPVRLFNYRESDNSLYSYAKLKIFYVGQTGDKRLFTKKFSDQLISSLPYVPVVGYYDEEDEDFKGHHIDIQNIYGIVPEDTMIEYIEEDGKEYAVCDVILYTGRKDRTGEIAQKIIGKQHSLELNPDNTTYEINRDEKGQIKNIEFKTGSLLGLSILGDNERPAFSGSGFFTEDSEFMKLFEGFKKELEKFTKENQQRGETMENNTENVVVEEVVETVEDTNFTSEDNTSADLPLEGATTSTVEEEVVETTQTEETFEESEEIVEEKVVYEIPTREQKFAEAFMKVTYDEVQERVLSAFYTQYGENVYVVQWSPFDDVLVYMNFEDWKYYRVDFVMNEEDESITFGEKVLVKPRFLTEEEINSVFLEGAIKQEFVATTELGTENESISSNTDNEDGANEQFEETTTVKTTEESEEELIAAALNSSEREELEAFREEKKGNLIDSFEDDISKDFLKKLKEEIAKHSYDELEVILSREFTRISRPDKKIKPLFAYVDNTLKLPTNEQDVVKALVEQYKTKK